MKHNKHFLSGILVGISLVIILHLGINSASIIYSRFISHELTTEQKLREINAYLQKYYVNDIDENMLKEGLYTGLAAGVNDRYTYYMDKETFNQFIQDTDGNYSGIGVVIYIDKDDNKLTIQTVYEQTPAFEAGLKTGDKILKVNGIDIGIDNYKDAVAMLKTKEGTKSKLTIYRKEQDKTFDVDIVSKSVDVPTVSHSMIDNTIGYIIITKFDRVTYDQFVNAYNDLTEKGMQQLIIDLRDNPGGLLDTVVKITDMLVPEGYITYIEDKNGNKKYEFSDENAINKPLAILVNGNSASASEVLSGAVKDMKAGKLVGTKTFGKGVVQNTYRLSDKSGLKVTVAKYYTPSGICIDGIGIEPDYKIEMPETEYGVKLPFEQDLQLQKAIDVVKEQ